mgnify:CR=1 FL=1
MLVDTSFRAPDDYRRHRRSCFVGITPDGTVTRGARDTGFEKKLGKPRMHTVYVYDARHGCEPRSTKARVLATSSPNHEQYKKLEKNAPTYQPKLRHGMPRALPESKPA